MFFFTFLCIQWLILSTACKNYNTTGDIMKKLTLIISALSLLAMSACYPFIKDIPNQAILADNVTVETPK